MKKALIITGTVYTIACLGIGIWMMARPEEYGKYLGKVLNGFCKAVEE